MLYLQYKQKLSLKLSQISWYCRLPWKFLPRIFAKGLLERVGSNPWKVYLQINALFKPIRKSIHLRKFFDYSKGEVTKSLTTPTCPAHELIRLQFLAKMPFSNNLKEV